MLELARAASRSLSEYLPVVGEEEVRRLRALAEPLRGARVLHVNATPYGGGVAEMLSVLVPLMKDVGLDAEWRVVRGGNNFFRVTKAMHNSLQGMALEWTGEMEQTWLRYNDLNAGLFDRSYDFIVVHDPQPAGILEGVMRRNGQRPPGIWLWRCHIDTSSAMPQVWEFLRPFVMCYDGAIFTRRQYINGNLDGGPQLHTVWPAIDPLSPKNVTAAPDVVAAVKARYGIDENRPLLCQVSRFDPWKDPLGVIDVYRRVKRGLPGLQLAMAGSMAADDPEGEEYFRRTLQHAGGDADIHLMCNLSDSEVGALQQAADVVIQKSIREGFGLTVAEALWKGRPVVAGNVGGIPLQIEHGQAGFLASDDGEYAACISYLLRHPEVADEMGRTGKEGVRRKFLVTRNLADYLWLFSLYCSREAQLSAAPGVETGACRAAFAAGATREMAGVGCGYTGVKES